MIRREMVSKYPNGRCKKCNGGIAQGELIIWIRNGDRRGRGSAYHITCEPTSTEPSVPIEETPEVSEVSEAPEVKTVRPKVSDDPTLDMLARALLPRLEALGIETGPREVKTTVRHDVYVTRPDAPTVIVNDAHPQFDTLLAMVAARQNAYTWGAPGAGKSHAAMEVARVLDRPFRSVSLSPQSMPSLLFGYMDAKGSYVSTGFRHMYEQGGVLCIDEVDNANANLLASLNSALANGLAEFPDAQVKRHPDCIVIATGNTPGFGPTLAFPERRPLDRAFRDRFAFLRWHYAPDHERTVARTLTNDGDACEAWATWIHEVRAYAATAYPALTCSPRSIYAGVTLLGRMPVAEVAESTLFQGIEDGVSAKILAACPLPAIKVAA